MNNLLYRAAIAIGLVGAGLAFSPVAVAKDDLTVSSVNLVTVGGVGAPSGSTSSGGNRHLTITNPIVGAQEVKVAVTWSIAVGGQPNTSYPKNGVTFSAQTSNGTSVGTIDTVTGTPACNLAGTSTTCSQTTTFTTPNVTGTIQVKVDPVVPNNTGNSSIQTKSLFINFSVIQQVAKLDTKTTVPDPQCFMYQAGNVDLKASLAELLSGSPIPNASMNFKLDGNSIGSTSTGTNGEATLTYSVNQLAAGEYNLFVAFSGDASYNPSDSSATLGIYYHFIGFQQPINPEGNSIFGNGRVIPIKIRIADANNQPVTNAQPTVWVTQFSESLGLGEVLEPATSVSAADTGNIMRYVASDNQYIYNWDLSSLKNGSYAVVVDLGDSKACSKGPYYAVITVAKKGGK
jgi:hypothetical protein